MSEPIDRECCNWCRATGTSCDPDERGDMEQRFSEFLCEVTDGLLSNTGYDVRTMVSATDEAYERHRDESDAAVAAKAWAEGHAAGRDYQADGWNSDAHDPAEDNPYREGASHE